MLSYYFNLPKDREREFDANLKASYAIQKTAKEAFEPFEAYLENAIKALEKKADVKAKWKKVDAENLAELQLVGGLYEVSKQTFVRLEGTGLENAQIGDSIFGSAGQHQITGIKEEGFVLDVLPDADEMLFWEKKQVGFSIVHSNEPNGTIIQKFPSSYIVYSDASIRNGSPIKGKKLSSFIDFENLEREDGTKLSATRNEDLSITLSDSKDYGKKVYSNQLVFSVDKVRSTNKDAYWIQLEELDEQGKEDIPGFSPLRYFFDDGIGITDDEKNEYQIAAGIESENRLVLRKGNEKGYLFCFPPDKSVLTVRVNTYSSRKQKEAIRALLQMPVGEQTKLIKLFENRDLTKWQAPDSTQIRDWFVLTDDNRSGAIEQREFVRQAIKTPDFAILEGPPGSGKTTVILELICQLAKQGKRVLLCGSTHVSIDNVVERLKEKRNGINLLERFNILPVRIGDEQRINEDVRKFQINNLIEDNDIDETLLLEASNLVCGTTIGILQHPKFKERNKTWRDTPIVPEFDYLIIDESSKTTFQEFLVPALYAKKWILVGDVMQLSPFTDREEIVCNIEQLCIDGKPLEHDLQQAIFFLHLLKDCLHGKNNKFVLPVSNKVLRYIIQELEEGRKDYFKNKMLFAISNTRSSFDHMFFRKPNEVNRLELSVADVIFVEDIVLDEIMSLLPESHALLRSTKWAESGHAFAHNTYQKKHPFQYRQKGKDVQDSIEIVEQINEVLYEKSWAEEIAWRVDREHQLRMVEKSRNKGNYGKVIQELLPKSIAKEKVESQINQIASMAFPSILESLVKGISGRKTEVQSTISEGFRQEDLEKRKTTLLYQHRMHPEISKFPRERFYQNGNALMDLQHPSHIKELREWNYNEYNNRSVWLDVKGATIRSYNEEEVKALMKHLNLFLEYAKQHPQPEGKEWTVACLTFYRGQETRIREKLQQLTGHVNGYSNFKIESGRHRISIKLHTVDQFQGHEADIVFLSMVQTNRDGFLDNPNRLNVAITRARFQLVIIGNHDYFSTKSQSDDLQELAKHHKPISG